MHILALDIDRFTRVLQWFTHHGAKQLDTPTRLMSGALAGITSVCTSGVLILTYLKISAHGVHTFGGNQARRTLSISFARGCPLRLRRYRSSRHRRILP